MVIFRKTSQPSGCIAGLLVIAAIAACTPPAETALKSASGTPVEPSAPEPSAGQVTQEALSSDTESLIGETVAIRGEVREMIEGISFVLEDEQVFGGEDILVINQGEPIALLDGDESDLRVIGTVQRLGVADFAKEYGLTLDPELYAKYEARPAILAQSVLLAPSPDELTREPEKYYNRRLAVVGEVEEILSPTTFVLDEEQMLGGEDLLVIGQAPMSPLEADADVVVTGILRPYISAEFEREYDLDWDLSVKSVIEAEYTEKPVFVADEVSLDEL
ncbi:MAG: hypothetical protein AAF152_09400 [Cyanobacteria bacterium P01_A01_bin.114]